MTEFGNVLFFILGASLAGAATLAIIPTFQSNRLSYGPRLFHFRWRYCLPALLLEEVVLFFRRFDP